MDVGTHAHIKNRHKTAKKTYVFFNFMIPPVKPASFMNLSGSGTRHLNHMYDIDYNIFLIIFSSRMTG
jgi:peptidyl-tRNA hydrolase